MERIMENRKAITLSDLAMQIQMLANVMMVNKPTLTLEEAAIYTGLSESFLYKLTSTQQIPHFKPRGKMLYFDRVELDSWLRQNRVSSTSEIEAKVANHLVRAE
jgi:excisionase family DNA binding protein